MLKKLIMIYVTSLLLLTGCVKKEELFTCYLGGADKEVIVLDDRKEEHSFPRGTIIERGDKMEDGSYRIYIDNEKYFASENDVHEDIADIVHSRLMYVREDGNVYADGESDLLSGIIEQGEEIEIIGYSGLKDDGSVLRYKTAKGYVRSEYLVEELSDLGTAGYHSERGDAYGAGSAYDLDYIYRDKPTFEDNVMPGVTKTLYINENAVIDMDQYVDFALNSGINALVVNIRDSNLPAYCSTAAEKYSPSTYENGVLSFEEYQRCVKIAKDAGLYLIGRITVFKDSNFAQDNPDTVITSVDDGTPFYYGSSYWPSPFKREVWEYNLEIAKEAVEAFGFNEIQFDYVRFPEGMDYYHDYLGLIDLKNDFSETRSEAIVRFLKYVTDELHDEGVYVSADVFGETSNPYVTGYGQYWPAISGIVDVISPMPYPDHFNAHDYGIKDAVWTVPYELLSIWASHAHERQMETSNPAKVRTYIQGYDSFKTPPAVYDNEKIVEQIRALKNQDMYDGFIVWNGASSLAKYESYTSAFLNE